MQVDGAAQPSLMNPAAHILIDTREPWPHPWMKSPAWHGVTAERATMQTGDVALEVNPSIVVERKTAGDLLMCIGAGRERFEKELRRSRHCDSFVVVVEADLQSLLSYSGGMNPASIMGTLAAWSRRYCPIIFAGTSHLAADFALRFLTQPLAEARRIVAASTKKSGPIPSAIQIVA